jgi:hypothetical protein
VDVIKHLLALLEDLLSVYESVEKENLKMNAAVCVLAIFHLVDQTAFNAYLYSMTPHSREVQRFFLSVLLLWLSKRANGGRTTIRHCLRG